MSTETVDIIVKEVGSLAAAANVKTVGTAAAASSEQMEKLLLMMGGTNMKLAEVARATGSLESQMVNLGRSTSASTAQHKEHNDAMAHGAEQASRLREMLVAVGLALGVHEWVELTDQYQKNVNGLVQVTTSQENLVASQQALKQVSMETFSSLDNNTRLYVQMTKAGKDLNMTQDQMITVIRVLNDGLRLAGNSTQDAGRAISMLSVAMMTGEGSSRAMMSIMRQMPDLTQALAAKFFTGRDSVLNFKNAVEGGTVSVQQVMRAIVSLSSQQDTLAQATQNVTGATQQAIVATRTEAEEQMIAAGRMFDFSKVTGEAGKHVIDLSHDMSDAGHSAQSMAQHVTQTQGAAHQATTDIQKLGTTTVAAMGQGHAAIQRADGAMSQFERNVKKVEPTIADAWQNMKTALFSYVGEADQASRASEKIAHMIEFAAQHGKVFFGIIGVITAFLGTYATAAGLAAAGTFLFVHAFSPLALTISIVAALTVAVYTFGQSIKITADGSISAMGAVLGVFDLLKQGVMAVWNLVMQAPGYWGPAIIAVTGLTLAMRVLLGVNIIMFLGNIIAYMGALTLATIAALGPWGLLTAAIVAATLAWAYWTGQLDGAIATLKEKLEPVVTGLIDKMKQFTSESQKSGTAAKEFGNVWTQETSRVTNGFENGLLPSIRNVDTALAKLKTDAVADMGATKSAVSDVAAELNKLQTTANTTSSSMENLKTSTGSGGSGGGRHTGDDPKTYTFTTWNTPDVMKAVGNAWQRAAQISNEDGKPPPKDYDMAASLFRGYVDDPGRHTANVAEIIHILSKLSDGARTYLRNTTVGAWVPGLQYGGSFDVGGQGGRDTQLVQFMATPGERVQVNTPDQQRSDGSTSSRPVTVYMQVVANDASSFTKSKRQIATRLQSELSRVAMRS